MATSKRAEGARVGTAAEPVLFGPASDAALTDQLLSTTTIRPRYFRVALALTGLGTLMLVVTMAHTMLTGIGVWGNNIPVAWGFAIINFVWWIGIGHAGTFISAILLLSGVRWRTSINRLSEAMTLFAVMNAGLFPILHLGRPWFAYWLFPYPSTMAVWPQFKSALPWDGAAITTYFTVSLLFWYLGLVPDFGAMRDRANGVWRRRIYGVFALGWRHSARHWHHWRSIYFLLAGLATPLVISVHSIVSFDFAITQLPGWHSPMFPPYFVAGAIFSGFAMVLTLMLPVRVVYGLENVITKNHLDNMAKLLLVTGWIVSYSYVIETFVAWYSGNEYERYTLLFNRPFGPYAFVYWTTLFCNVLVPQIFWWKRCRQSAWILWVASIFINIGMWCERFMLIVTSQHRDFLPSAWRLYMPTVVDGAIFIGTICFFLFAFLIFIRVVPFIPLSEIKELRHELQHDLDEGIADTEAAHGTRRHG